MNTQHTRTPALVATAAVLACLFVTGCGTETAAPGSPSNDTRPVTTNTDDTWSPGSHKKPPDYRP